MHFRRRRRHQWYWKAGKRDQSLQRHLIIHQARVLRWVWVQYCEVIRGSNKNQRWLPSWQNHAKPKQRAVFRNAGPSQLWHPAKIWQSSADAYLLVYLQEVCRGWLDRAQTNLRQDRKAWQTWQHWLLDHTQHFQRSLSILNLCSWRKVPRTNAHLGAGRGILGGNVGGRNYTRK